MDFPSVSITNGQVKLKLYIPAGEKSYYVGSRFEHSGVVARAEWNGHTFFGEWQKRNPKGHDHIMGTAEEFSMEDPPGFDEVEAGGVFYKIGVGGLVKKEAPRRNKETGQADPAEYAFWGNHQIAQPAGWKVTSGGDWVRFEQDFRGERGWAWRYVKRVQLAAGAPSFTISRELTNTGTKPIDTTHYGHNFVLIDDQPVGPDYRVRLPFHIEANQIKGDGMKVEGNRIVLTRDFTKGTVWADLLGFSDQAADNAFTVENARTGAALRVEGDYPLLHLRFWAIRLAACPEPFAAVRAAPGKSMKWSTTYTLSAGPAQKAE